LNGSAGCGKTFLYNTLIYYIIYKDIPYIACAMTGIAALLIENAKTMHSALKMPINL